MPGYANKVKQLGLDPSDMFVGPTPTPGTFLEKWLSGLKHILGKDERDKTLRGFKSHFLRIEPVWWNR
jgi:hypothetical protein